MRKVFLKFCLILIYFSTIAQSNLDDKLKQKIVINRIKSITNFDYQYIKGKPAKTGQKTIYTTYNFSGYVKDIKTFNSKGIIINSEKYEFDSKGNRTLYERYKGDGASLAYKKISEYNLQSDITSEYGFDGVINFKNVYNYNSNGTLKEILYYVENRIDEKRIYEYSGNTAKVKVKVLNANNNVISNLALKYDNNKNVIEEIVYGINNKELEKKVYEYDSKSNLLSESIYRDGNLLYEVNYKYNASGDLTEVHQKNAGQAEYVKKSYAYNMYGDLVEYKWRRNADDKFDTKTYQYNERGICITENTYYAKTDFQVLTKYIYEFY